MAGVGRLRERFRAHGALITLAGTAMLVSPSEQAFAQAASTRSVDERELQDIVVTARKIAENLQDTPLAISALTAQTIEDQRINSVVDLQHVTPGLFIQAAGADISASLITLRGNAQQAITLNQDPAVGYYIDGVYVGITGSNLNNTDDVARIEVLKGPQGTLYGRNTTGGAINIFHNLPTDHVEGWLRGGLGNFGLREVAAMVNLPFGQSGAALRVAASRSENDGYGRDIGTDRDLQQEKSRSIRATLRAEAGLVEMVARASYRKVTGAGPGDRLQFVVPGSGAAAVIASQLAGNPAAAAIAVDNVLGRNGPVAQAAENANVQAAVAATLPNRFNDANLDFPQAASGKVATGSLEVSVALSDETKLKSISAYQESTRHSTLDLDGSPFDLVRSEQATKAKQFTQEFQIVGSVADSRLKYTIGSFYYWLRGNDDLFSSVLPSLFGLAGSQTSLVVNHARSYSGYAQVTYAVTPRVNITGGFRYTHESKRLEANNQTGNTCVVPGVPAGQRCYGDFRNAFSNASYLASIDYHVNDDLMIYGRTARGFRSGGQQQRNVGLRPFDPEIVTDYEIGAKADLFDRRLRLNVALYHQDISGIQRTAQVAGLPPPAPPVVSIVTNAASGTIRGAELDLTMRPVAGLTIGGAMSYVDPSYRRFFDAVLGDQKDQPFQAVPKFTYTINASYVADLGGGRLRFGADWYRQSSVYLQVLPTLVTDPSVNRQRAYGLLGANVAFEVGQFELSLWGKNLTNRHYNVNVFDFATSRQVGFAASTPGAPRTYGAQIKMNF